MSALKSFLKKSPFVRKLYSRFKSRSHTKKLKYYTNEKAFEKKIGLCITESLADKYVELEDSINIGLVICDNQKRNFSFQGRQIDFNELKNTFEYIWFLPEKYIITVDIVYEAVLLLTKTKVNFILFSFLLRDMPNVAVLNEFRSNIIIESCRLNIEDGFEFKDSLGKIVRLFREDDAQIQIMKAESFFGDFFNIYADLYYDHEYVRIGDPIEYGLLSERFQISCEKTKPCIFVIPVYLFVGGVERNTIEVMRMLQKDYDFIVITLEGIMEQNGSLHYQMRQMTNSIYDFHELFDYSVYSDALKDLRNSYKPDAVWICNGSNWLCDHAGEIRQIFKDVPIIDQQVYDTQAGWIERYAEKGIQSFDRFIAINQRIFDKFVDELKMDSEKIDLIYPTLDLGKSKAHLYDSEKMKEKYEIPNEKKLFAYIGRVTDQKRPELFLDLVHEINKRQGDNHFMMIGNGPLKEAVEEKIKKLGIMNITLVDYVSDVCEVFCFLDGVIFVSKYEGLPITILESIVNAVPVLSTDVGDVRLVLDKYGAGCIFRDMGGQNLTSMTEDFCGFKKNLGELKAATAARKQDIVDEFCVDSISKKWRTSFDTAMKDKLPNHQGTKTI